ncbi:Crp/Fnr family transcriptional regulator [Flammeovirgaceae bacterium SG7u.111]|nr:Crp/Fnr family transcriptional regulator [Flammeovirgaceae bacterium SG7u.132]WPO38186.1 Crp/Fnr family transcriptional regulator [Flammeovirgaceae bacterium SG7u.111]
MENKILKHLSKYTVITKEIKTAISESISIKTFKKGSTLLKEGSISNNCYFLLKGCVRSYFLKNGEEKTIEFYTEEQSVIPASYGTPIPSDYYIECLEDTIASVGNPILEKETFQKYPQLESLSRIIAETIIIKQQELFTQFKTSTPEERYLNLLKTRPNLIQRVHQHQIASYLGIKPESLSRIRKRTMGKK